MTNIESPLQTVSTASVQTAARFLRASCCLRDTSPQGSTTPAAASGLDITCARRAISCIVNIGLRPPTGPAPRTSSDGVAPAAALTAGADASPSTGWLLAAGRCVQTEGPMTSSGTPPMWQGGAKVAAISDSAGALDVGQAVDASARREAAAPSPRVTPSTHVRGPTVTGPDVSCAGKGGAIDVRASVGGTASWSHHEAVFRCRLRGSVQSAPSYLAGEVSRRALRSFCRSKTGTRELIMTRGLGNLVRRRWRKGSMGCSVGAVVGADGDSDLCELILWLFRQTS